MKRRKFYGACALGLAVLTSVQPVLAAEQQGTILSNGQEQTAAVTGDNFEPNNERDTAAVVGFPTEIRATLDQVDDVDWYCFTLNDSAVLNLVLTPPANHNATLALFDEYGGQLAGAAIENATQNIRYSAESGTYYVRVKDADVGIDEPYVLSLQREMDSSEIDQLDLSEWNMLMALTDTVNSPVAWQYGVNGGGHVFTSTAYFASWYGPVSEKLDVYDDTRTDLNFVDYSNQALYHVQNALYLPNDSKEAFISHVKSALYNYGAVGAAVMAAWSYFTPDYKNLFVDDAYQYRLSGDGGHTITIVGWDDNYSKDNFTGNPQAYANETGQTVTIPKPQNDGAFICKNSWGTENAGEDGFFYLSYEDSQYLMLNPTVYFADEVADNYNRQYTNSIKGTSSYWAPAGETTVSEKFVSKSNELLKAVSFEMASANTHYTFYLRKNNEPDAQMKKIAEGTKKYAGFYTVRLPEAILLEQGDNFEIILHAENTTGGNVSVGMSINFDGIISVPARSGIAFEYYNGEKKDLGATSAFPNIRAYTCDVNSNTYSVETESNISLTRSSAEEDEVSTYSQEELDQRIVTPEGILRAADENSDVIAFSLPKDGPVSIDITSLPAAFDLRNIDGNGKSVITGVRNQGGFGSCWTFGAMASLESNIARNNGYAVAYPKTISITTQQESVVLNKDQNKQVLELTAILGGGSSSSSEVVMALAENDEFVSSKINWSVTGDVDSVEINSLTSNSGETMKGITAVSPGIITVTATSDADMNVSASCQIVITSQGVETITVSPDTYTLKPGDSQQLTPQILPANAIDQTLLYTSDHPEVAYVDGNGLITAMAPGTAKITIQSGNGIATVTVTVEGQQDPVADFVTRLYENILQRKPDAAGLLQWTEILKSGQEEGAKVALGFFQSPEFVQRGLSNGEYVEILYKTLLGREADGAGYDAWVDLLDSGMSRLYVFRGFAESMEFYEICQEYGIIRGNVPLTRPQDQNEGVTKFIVRCYRLCLKRDADESGLNSWCNQLLTGKNTAKEVARGFVFSDELKAQNLSNEAYIRMLYEVFMDRGADPVGLSSWLNVLNGGQSREHVFDGFADSVEFRKLCEEYGIR